MIDFENILIRIQNTVNELAELRKLLERDLEINSSVQERCERCSKKLKGFCLCQFTSRRLDSLERQLIMIADEFKES
jgi:hypothetical protein